MQCHLICLCRREIFHESIDVPRGLHTIIETCRSHVRTSIVAFQVFNIFVNIVVNIFVPLNFVKVHQDLFCTQYLLICLQDLIQIFQEAFQPMKINWKWTYAGYRGFSELLNISIQMFLWEPMSMIYAWRETLVYIADMVLKQILKKCVHCNQTEL